MYRERAKGWLKHVDFMLLDVLSLELSFVLAYWIRMRSAHPYARSPYRNMGLALVLIGYCYFRMFSRNISGRNEENQKYLSWTAGIRRSFTQTKNRIVQSKDYHIYKCPVCGQKIRIPRGKGKICITCPKCRHEFEKRS